MIKLNTAYWQITFATVCFLLMNTSAIAHDSVVVVPLNLSGSDMPDVQVVTSANGRIWMDRNLGASQVATNLADTAAYGDMYQWGRLLDGHERRVSATTSILSTTDTPGHGSFITAMHPQMDWRNPQNDNLWQGVKGTNNPCPRGFRLPTAAEWGIEIATWGASTVAGGFASPLKLPAAGYRQDSDGGIYFAGVDGFYYSSTINGTGTNYLYLSSYIDILSVNRSFGMSVRCIKD